MKSNRILFGQFLIENKKINKRILAQAIKTQEEENISKEHRMLGSILMNDFKVFRDRKELKYWLNKYEDYKIKMADIYNDAKTFGNNNAEKLHEEYAHLIEELELPPGTSLEKVVEIIQNFRLYVKQEKEKSGLSLQEMVEKVKEKNE